MRRMMCLAPILVAAALTACVRPVDPIGSEPVDARYSVSGGSFDTGGSLIVMLRAFERDGRVAVCGAMTTTRESAVSLPYGNRVRGAGVVQLGGRSLFQGLHPFPEHPLRQNMTGVSARCLLTGEPWQPRFADAVPRARFARMPFGHDDFGGPETVFRETGVPDVIARP